MTMRKGPWILLGAALLVAPLGACERAESPQQTAENGETLRAEPLGEVVNLHVFENFHLAGQPQPEDFRLLRDRGIRNVINFRQPGEVTGFDEEQICTDLDMQYHQIGFRTPEDLTDDVFDRSRELMREAGDEPVLVHCGSAGRVGAIWLVKRVLDDGVEWEVARAEAGQLGMPARFEGRALAYIEARRP